MKTMEDVFSEAYAAYEYYEDDGKRYIQILKEWVDSILDECAGNFECTLEQRDIEDEEACITLENGDQVYPVLVRASVLAVKEQLK